MKNETGISQLGASFTNTSGLECIILAGGLGTRLRSSVPDLPKCMAPVAGKPFLAHLLAYLLDQGVTTFIFSLGYRHEVIEEYLKEHHASLHYKVCIEDEPLGTGGAIFKACKLAKKKDLIVLNGDTLFAIELQKLMAFHVQQRASCTLSLKPMHDFDRYGVVEIDNNCNIRTFKEKKAYDRGLINGGVYALQVASFLSKPFPEKFSFEKDFLETYQQSEKMLGLVQDRYFIDIGIPEDFEKAGRELVNGFGSIMKPADQNNKPILNLEAIDQSWTLFLDRDGVINHEKHKDYIHTWEEFRFYEGVLDAMKIFASTFKRIIVVTNQRGVGKGVTKPEELNRIHTNMAAAIEDAGGRIDAIYFAPEMDDTSPNRKPNPGMGLKAVDKFPDIDLDKAIMVGNTMSDMEFGRNLGVHTVFLPTTRPEVDLQDHRIDVVASSLFELASKINAGKDSLK